ncbi:hypothetical protein L0U85_02035 [Glycomyces sp. L485]|uniref:hypothetical protein n=1 Tax=Glycomyces sp. L485 TaxID=2909235 RepID=UPI001F4A6D34|nr:hypothetical protein [Glycomyces sp. L485]MCH7229646.1 hypothetical protein [Glycomyces sp. L485]
MNTREIDALASRIDGIEPFYERTESGMRKLAADIGWQPTEDVEWPRAADGSLRGVACTASVDGTERIRFAYYGTDGVVVPVSRVADDAVTQAEEFRRVADVVQDAINPASFFGNRSPDSRGDRPDRGTPYLRWRGKYTTVELRAGESGPELVSDYTDSWEDAYRYSMARKPTGFVGAVAGPDRIQRAKFSPANDWDEFTDGLVDLLANLPAETLALGVSLSLPLFGRIHFEDGTSDSPLLFDIRCFDRLHIGYDGPDSADPASLGWRPTDQQNLRGATEVEHFESPWHFDAGGPGAVKAAAAAELIVKTAEAAGVRAVDELMLGGEAELSGDQSHAKYRGPYVFRYPGLRLRTV